MSVCLVTGSSRGIGKAIAVSLAKAGCDVVMNFAHDVECATRTKTELEQILNRPVECIRANCSNHEEVNEMFKTVTNKFGRIDVLVNNAGITRDKLAIKMTISDFKSVIDLNLNGTFYCSQAAISGSMLKHRSGRIINISSVVGQLGNSGQSNYAASKAGVIGLSRSLAREYANRNITVNVVCPGYIEGDMTSSAIQDAKQQASVLDKIPLGRLGTAEEVAGLVRYLALDPSAAYVTGHCFNIDGGLAIGAN